MHNTIGLISVVLLIVVVVKIHFCEKETMAVVAVIIFNDNSKFSLDNIRCKCKQSPL